MRTERLIALKAFYLGRGIVNSPNKDQAVKVIKDALNKLGARNGPDDPLRRIFYLSLLAEIFREEAETAEYRALAKTEAEALQSDAYRFYMRIVEATQSRKSVGGLGGEGYIADRGIQNERGASSLDDWEYPNNVVTYDAATAAVGWDDRHFSEWDKKFLHFTSLREILEKHGLWGTE